MLISNSKSDNHGQNSWDKLELFALFHTQNKQWHATKTILALPLPPPSYSVGHVYPPFFSEFQLCIGGGGRLTHF